MVKVKHCCSQMKEATKLNCKIHNNIYDCLDVLISFYPKFYEYGIIVHDGGTSSISIKFCQQNIKQICCFYTKLYLLGLKKSNKTHRHSERTKKY